MKSLKKMTEELHLSNGKHPLLQWSTATAGGKFEKSSTIGKGFPIETVGAGTVHFMKSLFSESKGFLHLDFQGHWVSSAGQAEKLPCTIKRRENQVQVRWVCAGRESFAGTINSRDTVVANWALLILTVKH